MTIFWIKRREKRLIEIKEYLLHEFGESTERKFISKIVNFIELLSKYPELGTIVVREKEIYGFQLTKQTKIFYRIHISHISILTLFDSRQHPNMQPK